MDHEIHGFSLEKQQDPVFCWAAAAQAVRKHYGIKPMSQHEINRRFGRHPEQTDRNFAVSGDPWGPIADVGCADGPSQYYPKAIADQSLQRVISGRIMSNILAGCPIVVQVKDLPASNRPYSHALIITGAEVSIGDAAGVSVALMDPSRPEQALEVGVSTLLTSWQIYDEYPGLLVRARRLSYTNHPPESLATSWHRS